jgi:ribonuclease HII
MAPGVEYETRLQQSGYQRIAGIDEAGRGCWAGPVVAASVILAPAVLERPVLLDGIDDSKLLNERQREKALQRIRHHAIAIGIGSVPPYVIDTWGIVPATRMAMTIALLSMSVLPDTLLIDALPLEILSLPQQAFFKGDSQCLSIAAASIVAKVTRDQLMKTADTACPGYGFARHKGYGTALHQKALRELGPCVLHRLSFKPVYAIAVLL